MFLNTQTLILNSLSLALLTKPINSSPAPYPDPSKATTPVKWRLHLYQNTRCSGADTFYSGSSSRNCENEILNGGALGYISENGIHQLPCEVVLFADEKCKRAVVTIAAGSHSSKTCQGSKVEIRSFEVRC
ncbi:hypothetical protein CFD26_105472 [Aspergillus turcosus]|uniref:Uncharacterized protein n=1 Tax=Aspergillus turcosus TaxID=1245748 RepID=A0A3R7J5M2_9EURO|nr:hypothetical protein CFD26_105472 [Aspergillus turcosus]